MLRSLSALVAFLSTVHGFGVGAAPVVKSRTVSPVMAEIGDTGVAFDAVCTPQSLRASALSTVSARPS